MAAYVVCKRNSSEPRLDIRICAKKCEYADQCTDYNEVRAMYGLEEELRSIDPLAYDPLTIDPFKDVYAGIDPLADPLADPLGLNAIIEFDPLKGC